MESLGPIDSTFDIATRTYVDQIAGGGWTTSVTVDFGSVEQATTTVTVTDPRVSAAGSLMCLPAAVATADHDPDDYALEGIQAYVTNIIDGVSFDLTVSCRAATWGRYVISILGTGPLQFLDGGPISGSTSALASTLDGGSL
jgi:hypothetical protein